MSVKARLDRLSEQLPQAKANRPMTAEEIGDAVGMFRAMGRTHMEESATRWPELANFIEIILKIAASPYPNSPKWSGGPPVLLDDPNDWNDPYSWRKFMFKARNTRKHASGEINLIYPSELFSPDEAARWVEFFEGLGSDHVDQLCNDSKVADAIATVRQVYLEHANSGEVVR